MKPFAIAFVVVVSSFCVLGQTKPRERRQPARGGSLTIEAALFYQSGDVQAVAFAKFYLLDENLIKILRSAGLYAVGIEAESGDTDENLLLSYGLAMKFPSNPDYITFHPAATQAVKRHIKYEAKTDEGGSLVIANLRPGKYYIYGHLPQKRGFVLWSVPVQVRAGSVKIFLDQNNAAYAF